jgi:hypothetical protein
MHDSSPVDSLGHDEIRDWLERALHGREPLPLAERGEFPHLAIARLSKSLKATTRESLRDGCIVLVRQFCSDGSGDGAYLEELLALASTFKAEEAVPMLAGLALRFPAMPQISEDVRLAVLATLVDTRPPQTAGFWEDILAEDRELYAGLALSGVLATNHAHAIRLLTAMPDVEDLGDAAAMKLELAWIDLPAHRRTYFVDDIRAVLGLCAPRFAAPVRDWLDSKEVPPIADGNLAAAKNQSLADAICNVLGTNEAAPKHTTPKIAA